MGTDKEEVKREGAERMHIAQIGTGRVGRPTAYTLLCAGLPDTLTVCDTKPGLATAFAEELRHVTASLGLDVEIHACDQDDGVAGADLILISAGEPRPPGVNMSRRDLAIQNGKTVKFIAETTASRNPSARYIVITNPVDAMAMICKRYTKARFVISTGTNLESLRFRAHLAQTLNIPVSKVEGWVGGEHGDAAIPLWSTTRIHGLPLEEYAHHKHVSVPKADITEYVKTVSKLIVDGIGGTEFGPAASFRDIVHAIVNNAKDTLAIAAPTTFPGIPEPVFVSIPTQLGLAIGPTRYHMLADSEKQGLARAADAVYGTYQTARDHLE